MIDKGHPERKKTFWIMQLLNRFEFLKGRAFL